MRSAPSEFSMACPPSMPSRHAIFPALFAASMSAAVSASTNLSGYLAIIRRAMSNSSSWILAYPLSFTSPGM